MTDHVRPKTTFRRWMLRYSLTLVAALGGAAGVAYAAGWHRTQSTTTTTSSHTVTTVAVATPIPTPAPVKPAELPRDNVQDVVQIALLLDTSSSMDGLINQARSHLWNMVDKMGRMTRVVDGKTRGVKIELALYEYGNDTLSGKTGFIRQVLPLTTDLDKVSEKLHGLFTNGGSEYVGQVIDRAVTQLEWSKDPNAMKFIFVAGNEEFDQGPVTAAKAMAHAAGKDINVQLIHCGGSDPTWEAAAKLAKSDLMTIDQNHVAVQIPAPQDDEIVRLGNELNSTYMAYGAEGETSLARQATTDVQAANISPKVAIERAQLKSKKSYGNANWDVVDALESDARFLEQAQDSELPSELRGKTLEEKRKIVAANAAKRGEIQAKIGKLEAERAAFIQNEQARIGADTTNSLETELMKSTTKIASKKSFNFQ